MFMRFLETLNFFSNNKLSCATHVFLYRMLFIALEAEQKLDSNAKKNPQAIGRLAYELCAKAFAFTKPNVGIENIQIGGKNGQHKIPIRLYNGNEPGKFILFAHGGGWIQGNLETHDTLCRKLCAETGASVIAVDYRLAPEHPYPAALEDVEVAYKWFLEKHGKDAKIFLCGDSSGGNIVSSLLIKQIQKNKSIPDGVILIYPVLDLRIPEKTIGHYANGYLLTRDSLNAYIKHYIGNDNSKALNPLVSPILALDKDLKKFPKTIVVNAEYDLITKEGTNFSDRLKSLGVSVNHKVFPGTIHIFAQFFDAFPQAQEAMDFIKRNLREF